MDKEALKDLLLDGKIQEFNKIVEQNGGVVDLSGIRLRGVDLRAIKFKELSLENSYLRSADLRGLDLSKVNLRHASIKEAKISGVLFPRSLSAQEISLSVIHGTRMRMI